MTPTQTLITPDTIRTASLYPLATLEERTAGTARVLVTRYWPRGLKSERVYTTWSDRAPSRALLAAYKHDGLPWDEFARLYRIEAAYQLESLRRIARWMIERNGPITLLCVEHCPRDGHDESDIRCHRRLLRDLLLEGTQP